MTTPKTVSSLPIASENETAIGLRDFLAAHLAAAIVVAPKQVGVPRPDMEAMAAQAYEFADAMIRVRSR